MNARETLKMLNEDRIEELKDILQKEILEAELKLSPSMKKRHSAMKRYFGFTSGIVNPVCKKPCRLMVNGELKTSLTNGQSAILTKEDCSPMETIPPGSYVKIHEIIKHNGERTQIDFTKAVAKAKSLGYKIEKGEVRGSGNEFKYAFYYDGAYFKVGLVDATYAILNDGKPCDVYHEKGNAKAPITIENEIGIAMILPFHYNVDGSLIVIDLATAEEM